MSARIAPEPVSSVIASAPDFRSRAHTADTSHPGGTRPGGPMPEPEAESRVPEVLPPLPLPPDPPGMMFAAAVMSGALSPRPVTPQEVFLRLGSAWQAPESGLHLADRKA
jgi:hypothetical protein